MAVSLCFLSILHGYSIIRLTCSLHKPSISRFKSKGAFSFRTNEIYYNHLKRRNRHAEAEAFARSVNLRPSRHVAKHLADSERYYRTGLPPPYPYWTDPSFPPNVHPYLQPAYGAGPSITFPANALPGLPPPYPYWADPSFPPNVHPYLPPAYGAGTSITSPANALPGLPPPYPYWADSSFPLNALPGLPPPYPYWADPSFPPNVHPYLPPAYGRGPSITSPANALPGLPPPYPYWADPSFPPNAYPYLARTHAAPEMDLLQVPTPQVSNSSSHV